MIRQKGSIPVIEILASDGSGFVDVVRDAGDVLGIAILLYLAWTAWLNYRASVKGPPRSHELVLLETQLVETNRRLEDMTQAMIRLAEGRASEEE